MKENIRILLNEDDKLVFDSIVNGVILGASKHIKMIAEMFVHIANENHRTWKEKKEAIVKLSEFFKETRGKSSYAFINAMNIMTGFLNTEDGCVRKLNEQVQKYFKQSDEHCEKIITYAKAESQNFQTIMVYDYSSTVEKFICSLEGIRDIYIPESRTIDGGKPFVKPIYQAKHNIHFIPDACMLSVLSICDAVFIGAETLYPDGTSFNTAGSDILAVLCKELGIPYYVLTPLIKTDMRALQGKYKEVIKADLKKRLTFDWEEEMCEMVDCQCIELVGIKPSYITAIITEEGILPPTAIYTVAQVYQSRMIGGVA